MSITAKELAQKLNLSEAAISMALNGKPGVSAKTRKMVLEEAHNNAYDFTKIKHQTKATGSINFIIYQKHGAVVNDTPFFSALSQSISEHCKSLGYKLYIRHIIDNDDIEEQFKAMLSADCIGIILLGTEIKKEDFFPFPYINLPIVLLDAYVNSTKMDSVLINNVEGAYQATHYLIKKRHKQPGYLHSSYPIYNFEERADGFYKAIRASGMSSSKSIVHNLSPSMEGAYLDMKAIINQGEVLADCYFADNDLIAAGAIKAFKEAGYRIPDDIAIIGFDNVPFCTYIEPNLTTINVPIKYMGQTAVNRLVSVLNSKKYFPVKIEISTNLIKRKSV